MKGRFVEAAIGALDAAARRVGRNPQDAAAHLITGRRGEEAAYFYLRRQGYVMVARNWRTPRHRGEIDLIGWDGDVLCFVEVKTRSTREVKPAEAAVDENKQKDLAAVAREYRRRVRRLRDGGAACRFDVISVYYDSASASPDITLFKNAFAMP